VERRSSQHVVTLKDARTAVIRPVRIKDAASLLACQRAVLEAGEGVVRSADQLPQTCEGMAEELVAWTDGIRNGVRGAMLVCELGGEVIGEGTIRRMSPKRLRHVAHVSVEVHPAHQGVGVGRALMNALIDWAKGAEGAGLLRIDLGVFATNARAIRLYESLGFRIEGTRERFVRFEDGTFADDHVMALMLEEGTGARRHEGTE
jgi:RimJ/RimL family protein N-acetyltransferase